jgi:hypothetical protein
MRKTRLRCDIAIMVDPRCSPWLAFLATVREQALVEISISGVIFRQAFWCRLPPNLQLELNSYSSAHCMRCRVPLHVPVKLLDQPTPIVLRLLPVSEVARGSSLLGPIAERSSWLLSHQPAQRPHARRLFHCCRSTAEATLKWYSRSIGPVIL